MMTTANTTRRYKRDLLGVCAGFGEDFGFNPEILRVAFVAAMLVAPQYTIGAYLAAAAVVALSRWLVPTRRRSAKLVAFRRKPVVETAPELAQAA